MDTEQTAISPIEKVEEPHEVSTLCNQGLLATRPISNMGEDE
jgi:hypothetical protein